MFNDYIVGLDFLGKSARERCEERLRTRVCGKHWRWNRSSEGTNVQDKTALSRLRDESATAQRC